MSKFVVISDRYPLEDTDIKIALVSRGQGTSKATRHLAGQLNHLDVVTITIGGQSSK